MSARGTKRSSSWISAASTLSSSLVVFARTASIAKCTRGSRPVADIEALNPLALVLSGGPQSVYSEDAPKADPEIFSLGLPILGICYGLQWIARTLGGTVEAAGRREYGRAHVNVQADCALFAGLEDRERVWMSHGDHVDSLPKGFRSIASTENAPIVGAENVERGIYGIQFHPEVSHTLSGIRILRNFLFGICGARGDWAMEAFADEAVSAIQKQAPEGHVICAISGGVDSSVAAALLTRALGERLTAVFVDNGVLRQGERQQVERRLREEFGIPLVVVDARELFLSRLAGITDPEEKRRIVGRTFIDVFEAEAAKLHDVRFLAQGTLYPDVIESVSVRGPSAVIKTHHNVGGLPERLGFELIEPLRMLFKDEVRELGRALGLPEDLVSRHPFSRPGARCAGAG